MTYEKLLEKLEKAGTFYSDDAEIARSYPSLSAALSSTHGPTLGYLLCRYSLKLLSPEEQEMARSAAGRDELYDRILREE